MKKISSSKLKHSILILTSLTSLSQASSTTESGPWAGDTENYPASNESNMDSVYAPSYCNINRVKACYEPAGYFCAIEIGFENCDAIQALTSLCPDMTTSSLCDESTITDTIEYVNRIGYIDTTTLWGFELITADTTTYSFPASYDDEFAWNNLQQLDGNIMALYFDSDDYMEYIQFLYETDENQTTDCSTVTEATIEDIEYQMTGDEGVYTLQNPTSIDDLCMYTLSLEYYYEDGASWIDDSNEFFPAWVTYDTDVSSSDKTFTIFSSSGAAGTSDLAAAGEHTFRATWTLQNGVTDPTQDFTVTIVDTCELDELTLADGSSLPSDHGYIVAETILEIEMPTYDHSVTNNDGRECLVNFTLEVRASGETDWEDYTTAASWITNDPYAIGSPLSIYTSDPTLEGTYEVQLTIDSQESTQTEGTQVVSLEIDIIYQVVCVVSSLTPIENQEYTMNGDELEYNLTVPDVTNSVGDDDECQFTFYLSYLYEDTWLTQEDENYPDWVEYTVDNTNQDFHVYLFRTENGITSDLDAVGDHPFQATWVSVVYGYYDEEDWGDTFEQSFTLTVIDSCVDDTITASTSIADQTYNIKDDELTVDTYTYEQSVINSDGRECPYTLTLEVQNENDSVWHEYGVSSTFDEDFPWFLSYSEGQNIVIYTSSEGKGTYQVRETAVSTTSSQELGTTSNQFQVQIVTVPPWMLTFSMTTLGVSIGAVLGITLLTNPYPSIQREAEKEVDQEEVYEFPDQETLEDERELPDWNTDDWDMFSL